MIVATLLERDVAGVAQAIEALDADADAFEIRLDAAPDNLDLAAVRRLTRKPLIAANRRREGGASIGEPQRLGLLVAAHNQGFDFVDVEGETPIGIPEPRLIRSEHWTSPAERTALIDATNRLSRGGSWPKIVSPAPTFSKILELLVISRRTQPRGSLLAPTPFPRALAHALGAPFVYGGGRTNAPGQEPVARLSERLRNWGDPQPSEQNYLVVGSPIEHSLSPRIHNAAFRETRLSATFAAMNVSTEAELKELLLAAPDLALQGLSVTAPLKQSAFRLVDRHTPEAERAKSVNCIRIDEGRPQGHNTDGIGARGIVEHLRSAQEKRPVLILGTGGAARGILASFDGIPHEVAGRNATALSTLAKEFHIPTTTVAAAARRLDKYALLINATTSPDPIALPKKGAALFDLHYAEEETPWGRHAMAHGLRFAGGKELLVEQALHAFRFWTGQDAPRSTMQAAAEVPH